MRIYLTFSLILASIAAFPQFQKFENELNFKRIGTERGLSDATVNVVLLDSKGFIWCGTEEGLNRYDGNQFKVFKARPDKANSLSGNIIHALHEDALGRIWIGTSEGLSRFDRHLEQFRNYALTGRDYFSSFDFEPDPSNNRIYIAAGEDGILYIDLATDELHKVNIPKLRNFTALKVRKSGNKLYVGTSAQGLYQLDLSKGMLSRVNLIMEDGIAYNEFAVRALLTMNSTLWVGTEGEGLIAYDTDHGTTRRYRKGSGQLSDDRIYSLAVDEEKIWAGTDGGGITVLDPASGRGVVYKHSYFNTRTISSNTIRSILRDRKGDLWFGTFNGGICHLPNSPIKFITFNKDPENPYSLAHNSVISFCELDNGKLLVGTDGGGLHVLHDGKFKPFAFPPGIKPPEVVLSIYETRQGEILLGTYREGLYSIRGNTVRHFTRELYDSSSISSNIIWGIQEDKDGNIWLATEHGLNKTFPGKWIFYHAGNPDPRYKGGIFTTDHSQSLLIDKHETLWVGYFGILSAVDLNTGRETRYMTGKEKDQIPNKQIISLLEDEQGTIWFSAFGTGIVRFDRMTGTFSIKTEDGEINNASIYAIQSDQRGAIWYTTNQELVRYNPVDNTYFVFGKDFGVETAPFKDNAGYRTSAGYILFGGTNGITAFWPAEATLQKNDLNVIVTEFRIFNREVPIDSTVLKRSITEETSLRIPYEKARYIDFDFSVPNFLSPSAIQYEYMLEGFDNNWQKLERKTVSLTSLMPDKYKLRIRAGYPSGLWGNETVLDIHVVPPWWMTPFARIAMVLAVAGLGYSFYRYRVYRLNMHKAQLEKIVDEQNKEIRLKNIALENQNRDLSNHNEELLAHRNTISRQNEMLFEAQEQLKEINQSLELLVSQRTEKLNDTISQLHKTIKELDAFLYSASHDLVSPLKSILGLVNLAKLETTETTVHTYLDLIEKSVTKLEEIIQTLMQHSFNTKSSIEFKPVRIRSLIEETIAELSFLKESAKIRFNYQLDDAPVVTDPNRLKIVLTNLIGNAIKYHDPKKRTNTIDVVYRNGGSFWSLDITDNGIGIEKNRLSRVFEMFYRATEKAKGSGLGLYIVKDTVERLGGYIEVDSEAGRWTKFSISLPVRKEIPGEGVTA
jgi:signal transduction histidine kinase/outer membrane protein assembly factor BamB